MQKKPYRPFEISCGLREGYDLKATEHTCVEALACIQEWMERRKREGYKIVAGIFLEGQFIYPWKEGEAVSSRYEPAFNYKGVVREDASDEEAIEMLEDLARALADTLKQERVHVVFGTDYFVVENK